MSPYEKLAKQDLDESNDHWLFQAVADHVHALLGQDWHPLSNVEAMPGVPASAKHVWYAWWFAAEVGGSGLASYVMNMHFPPRLVVSTIAALEVVGAGDLAHRVRSAVALSRELEAETWLCEEDTSLIEDIQPHGDYPTMASVDADIFEIVGEPFSKLVADYIRAHRHEL